jgi:dienelactone hydrolase
MWSRYLAAILACWIALAPAHAEERLLVEETFLSVDIGGQPYRLEALVAKEAGIGGRLPVAIITHGQAREAEQRERVSARGYMRTAREFARRGWLAVVVVRRGFGRSQGNAPFVRRGCRDGNFAPALDDDADDLEAAMKAVGRRADADLNQVIALGVSVGGAAVLALAARNPPGLRAVVNVSGGIRPLSQDGGPGIRCTPEDLVGLFADLGKRSRMPSLWLYAENDSLFPADYVRGLHEAYVAKGGHTDFHMFEPIGTDGHNMFTHADGMLRWIPALDRFLRANKLPTYDPAPLDALSGELGLNAQGRALLARYYGRPTDKILVMSNSKRWQSIKYGAADLDVAEKQGLEECAAKVNEPCRIVLRNFEVVREP